MNLTKGKWKRVYHILATKEDCNAIQETLFLLSVPGMRASIRRGLKTPISQCSRKLKW
jgi:antitoxin YefM